MRWNQTLLVCALWLVGVSAQAQWQWLDNSGRKVFSDQPPPSDIPVKNILKQPGKIAPVPAAAAPAQPTPVAAPVAAPAAASPQLVEVDTDLIARKKKAEAEVAFKIKAEADRLAKIKTTNCEKARANQALMDSGVRVSITNTKGEREILDDAARAAEQKKIRAVTEADCS